MKDTLQLLIINSLESLKENGVIEELPGSIRIDHSKDKSQGDFACNIALVLSKQAKCTPRNLAEKIVSNLTVSDKVDRVEIAGPGFINFFLSHESNTSVIENIIDEGEGYGSSNVGNGKRVLLEFVSANPTGPLHVGHGRGAAYGATVSNLLRAVGFEVNNEYYVNDAGRQMDILATSVYLRYIGTEKFPDNGYKGDYIKSISDQLSGIDKVDILPNVKASSDDSNDIERYMDDLIVSCKMSLGESYKVVFDTAINNILDGIKRDLSGFGVEYQKWFLEQSLIDSGLSNKTIKTLQDSECIYEKEGALWFRTTDFGDEKDRVVVRENGNHTYFASDIAYHLEKLERGYDKIINIWGADHHGYIARVKASISALGHDPDKLEVLLVQFANLYRKGKKVSMSTRSGSFVTLKELCDEVGNDAARFFYILRKSEQHMDFDLDLAKSKTNENPVFYIQYAHARICSVLKQASEKFADSSAYDLSLLSNDYEVSLIKSLNRYKGVVQSSALNYEPHVLAYYLRELAGNFHSYYNGSEFLVDDSALRASRLLLISSVRQVISNGLKLLGVVAPESM
ncbi:MAG TPA: arginine--tRNA ligase [Candidatus Thioglobus sp.]|nr:arginine--tRNA ligase [Candidatus Thioglobus sp.]